MKIQEQVFCTCGKGRSFLQCTSSKRDCERYLAEWLAELAQSGWRGVDLAKSKATSCNICNKTK